MGGGGVPTRDTRPYIGFCRSRGKSASGRNMGGSRKPLPLQLWALERFGHFWIETLRRLGLRLTSLHVLGLQTAMLQAYFCYTHKKDHQACTRTEAVPGETAPRGIRKRGRFWHQNDQPHGHHGQILLSMLRTMKEDGGEEVEEGGGGGGEGGGERGRVAEVTKDPKVATLQHFVGQRLRSHKRHRHRSHK